ncbi:tyrosine-protein phosphatase [Ketobacter nezhaii]|uniref:tyrosine-protein phosphatase n=1 Tax=Ketobacter sp. MCCC 1A13808 TaxID=2602738 RepID=UPI0012EB7E53|nr:tyrosine-protein phosphatase [Ketobacter sp. MCCC 1A13808]
MVITDRHIALNGSKNFRDFGAYPTRDGRRVKRGRLFRSDRLSDLSAEDLKKLEPFAIRTVFDLRGFRERTEAPTRWHATSTTRNVHLPLISSTSGNAVSSALRDTHTNNDTSAVRQAMVDLYCDMVKQADSLNCLQQIFQSLARQDELPVLVHCSGGKDRTGITCALILWTLGVTRDLILEDYLLSKTLYSDRIDASQTIPQALNHQKNEDWGTAAIKVVYGVEATFLNGALDYLMQTYGTAEQFAERALKLDSDCLSSIRHNLLEHG